MARRIALFVCVVAAVTASDEVGRGLTNDDVIRLVRAGFSEPTVLQAVRMHSSEFDVSQDAIAALRSAGVGEAVIKAMSGDRSQRDHLRLLEPGVYVRRGDVYAIVEAEPIAWKWQSSATLEAITRVTLAGHVGNRNSRLALTSPAELLIVPPPGVSAAAYQLLRADEKQEWREFRAEAAVRDGVLLGLSGRTSVPAAVDNTFDLGVRVLLGSLRKGEYGVVPPGLVPGDSMAAQGRIHTFSIE